MTRHKAPAPTADMLIQAASAISVQTTGRCTCVSGYDADTYVLFFHPDYQQQNRDERMLHTPELCSFNHAADILNVKSDVAVACRQTQSGTTRQKVKSWCFG